MAVTATIQRERESGAPWEIGECVALLFDGEEDSREWVCVEVDDGRLVKLATRTGEPRYTLNFTR